MKSRTNAWINLFILLCVLLLSSAVIDEMVLICGIGKNIEKAIPNVIQSATLLGEKFLDYRIIIYDNNSKDKTKKLLQKWAHRNPRVIFLSEYLDKKTLADQCKMKVYNRTEAIARARNKVLDVAMRNTFRDYAYVIWVDLDLQRPWDIANIIDTILHPEQEWDAVLANGSYDLFAMRDPEFPIGFELIGEEYYNHLDRVQSRFILDPHGPWRKVYSAFGWLGIYKRAAIRKCRYSGIVTKDLERVVHRWLERAYLEQDVCFLDIYEWLLSTSYIVDLYKEHLSFSRRDRLPKRLGMRLHNENGLGKVIWFSCTKKRTLPWICEHIPCHASMSLRGYNKIFINPRIISAH
jgi:glycosyltransferase involved in cell wall biosynthesis